MAPIDESPTIDHTALREGATVMIALAGLLLSLFNTWNASYRTTSLTAAPIDPPQLSANLLTVNLAIANRGNTPATLATIRPVLWAGDGYKWLPLAAGDISPYELDPSQVRIQRVDMTLPSRSQVLRQMRIIAPQRADPPDFPVFLLFPRVPAGQGERSDQGSLGLLVFGVQTVTLDHEGRQFTRTFPLLHAAIEERMIPSPAGDDYVSPIRCCFRNAAFLVQGSTQLLSQGAPAPNIAIFRNQYPVPLL